MNEPVTLPFSQALQIDRFTNNYIQIYGGFFPRELLTSYSINLLIINALP